MLELTADNVAEYLRSSGRLSAGEGVVVRELAGGVSNMVLLVERPAVSERFVLKQARSRLRVADEWLCPVERIWREVEVLALCERLVKVRGSECGLRSERQMRAVTPELLWEDRENYAYAMTAAPDGHRTWKQLLLAGELERGRELAIACGELLATLHAGTWNDGQVAAELDDRDYFERLRIEPYYRWIAKRHADLAEPIERLIASVATNRRCLVHGDFSPKNLLVWPGQVMLIDFEVGHYGDPAFDLGFFLTHLLLKGIWAEERGGEYRELADLFWNSYRTEMLQTISAEEVFMLEQRMLLNLAGCMLARVDGKSQVEYLSERQRGTVRDLGTRWLREPPASWKAALGAF